MNTLSFNKNDIELINFVPGSVDDHDNLKAENIKIQLTREPYEFPTLEIVNTRENIEDYCEEDFIIHNYKHHDSIKYVMVP